jgi:hypothetical protein
MKTICSKCTPIIVTLIALAEKGSLMGSVGWESGYAKMPTNQKLPECNISLLQKWIDDGSPNN